MRCPSSDNEAGERGAADSPSFTSRSVPTPVDCMMAAHTGQGRRPYVVGTRVPVSPGNTLTDTHAPKQGLVWAPHSQSSEHRTTSPRGLGSCPACHQEFRPCPFSRRTLSVPRCCRQVALLPGVSPTRSCPPDADSLWSVVMPPSPFLCSGKVQAARSLSSSFRVNTCLVRTELLWRQTFRHSGSRAEGVRGGP